jgi:hypothetical protein
VWTGSGSANGSALDASVQLAREFLVTPNVALHLASTGEHTLLLFALFPLDFEG